MPVRRIRHMQATLACQCLDQRCQCIHIQFALRLVDCRTYAGHPACVITLMRRGRSDERHQRDVHVEDVVAADILAELPDGLEERQDLDVADRAADLGDDHVDIVVGEAQDGETALVAVEVLRPDVVLLDTRSDGEYNGTTVRARRGGRIPGAVHVEWSRNLLRVMEALAQKFVQRPELCSDDAANKVERASFALTEIGFYFIVNHGIPRELIQQAFRQAARFHGQPIDDKMTLSVTIKISGEPTLADMAP